MRHARYQQLPAFAARDQDGDKCPNPERRRDHALAVAYLLTIFSIFLSLSLGAPWRWESAATQPEVLYRPNPYIGLERVQFAQNTTFQPIVSYPRAIFQISTSDAARMLREDDRQWTSDFGSVVPEDYHFVTTLTESSIVQFHVRDWGMEHCVLHLKLPSTVPSGSLATSLNIWRLDSDKELVPYIAWKQAPRRRELAISRQFLPGHSTAAIEFNCLSGSFPTFEVECSTSDPACAVDFWQDMARSADTGVYLVQHWSKR